MTAYAASIDGARGRFGQLTYSSFDSGQGVGGWQVKEERGLAVEESAQLTARIATRVDAGPTDRFPTPEQIAALPRRLVYAPLVSGGWAYWHTVQAGVDGTGRPGNVFAHVLLDRRPEVADDLRPIDLWRSLDWLTPFNPEQVVAAVLPAVDRPRPRADPAVLRDHVVDFLLGSSWRLGVFPGLLDATSAALAGGPPVVLGLRDLENGPGWISAVSHVMSPATARRLSFSTLERADGVGAAAAQRVHLICVPQGDLTLISKDAVLVLIDEDEIIQTGALNGEPHVTDLGSRISVTVWSGLARVALAEADTARTVLAEMDEVAHRVGDEELPPAWPLAVTVLAHARDLADAQDEAALAVLEFSPSLDKAPDLVDVVRRGVQAALGDDVAHAWAYVEAAGSALRSPTARTALDVYVSRALLDRAWLTAPQGVPLPDLAGAPALLVDRVLVAELVRQARERAVSAAPDELPLLAVELLRWVDLLVRARALSEREAVDVEIERLVVPLLLDPNVAPWLTAAVEPVDRATRTDVVLPLVRGVVEGMRARNVAPLGRRVPSETLAWLAAPAEEPALALRARTRQQPETMDVLEAERVVQTDAVTRSTGRDSPDTSAALVASLEELSRGGSVAVHLTDLVPDGGLGVAELSRLHRRFGPAMPPQLFYPAIKSAPSSRALEDLCEAIAPAAWSQAAFFEPDLPTSLLDRLVGLRGAVESRRWWRWETSISLSDRAAWVYAAAVEAALDVVPRLALPDEVVAHAQAAWVVATRFDHRTLDLPAAEPILLGRVLRGDAATLLLDITTATLEADRAAAFGAATAPGSPFAIHDPDLKQLAAIRTEVGGEVAPFLDHVVRRQLALGAIDVAALVEGARAFGARLDAADDDGQRGGPSWPDFVQAYVKGLSPKQGVLNATLGRFRRG